MRLGSQTHSVEMEQHYVPLSFTAGAGTLTATVPANTNTAVPGSTCSSSSTPPASPRWRACSHSAPPPHRRRLRRRRLLPPGEIKIGEQSILPEADDGNGEPPRRAVGGAQSDRHDPEPLLLRHDARRKPPPRDLRLDAGGAPGALKASTASFTPVAGWNTQVVTTPVALPAGTYWLSYLPSSNALGFRKAWTPALPAATTR